MNFERFINGELAVKCYDEEEMTSFLAECDKHGLKWSNGVLASLRSFGYYPIVVMCGYFGYDELSYTTKDYIAEDEYTIVRYSELFKSQDKLVAQRNEDTGYIEIKYTGADGSNFILLSTALKNEPFIESVKKAMATIEASYGDTLYKKIA